MLCKRFSCCDQHREFHELFYPVQVAEMFFCDGERIERSNARGFLAILDRKIGAEPA